VVCLASLVLMRETKDADFSDGLGSLPLETRV
jgi:hypothetical protein